MTLNITVLTRKRIFQSSDFRITDAITGTPFDRQVVKAVSLQYPTFDGMVTYTGIADTEGVDTAHQVVDWLKETADARFYEIVDMLRVRGEELVERTRRAGGTVREIAFVAVAFVDGSPVAATVSNFSATSPPVPALTTKWFPLKPDRKVLLLPTGWTKALTNERCKAVEAEIAELDTEPSRVRNLIVSLNREIARSSYSEDKISEACTVVTTDPFGTGGQDLSEPVPVELLTVVNGFYLDTLGFLGEALKGHFARSVSFASSKQHNAGPPPSVNCRGSVINHSDSQMQLQEIARANHADCTILGANESAKVLGASSSQGDPGKYAYWVWTPEHGLEYLDVVSWTVGGAINNAGSIALTISSIGGQLSHSVLYDPSLECFSALGTPSGMGSTFVNCINSVGLVGGWVQINLDETDGERQKPALWTSDGACNILREVPESESGSVESLNDRGTALVAGRTFPFGAVAIKWRPRSGSGVINRNALPQAIFPDGSIAFIGYTELGLRKPFFQTAQAELQLVDVQEGFELGAANDLKMIGGSVMIDGFNAPWVKEWGKAPVLLPSMEHHHGYVREITNSGQVVGQMAADDHQHAVFWSLGRAGGRH